MDPGGEGRMHWESTLTYTRYCVWNRPLMGKLHSIGSPARCLAMTQRAGNLRKAQEEGDIRTDSCFTLLYSRSEQHCKAIILQLKKQKPKTPALQSWNESSLVTGSSDKDLAQSWTELWCLLQEGNEILSSESEQEYIQLFIISWSSVFWAFLL